MKKQLIAVGLAGLLTIPTVSFSAEMAGPSLYGSFRTGLTFGSGDASVGDFTSRWGFKGSHEVSEGLTASYKYESKFNTTNAESGGGVGHTHPATPGHPATHGHDAAEVISRMSEIFAYDFGGTEAINVVDEDGEVVNVVDEDGELVLDGSDEPMPVIITPIAYTVGTNNLDQDEEGNVDITEVYIVDPTDDKKVILVRLATEVQEDNDNTQDVDESETPLYFRVINRQRSGYGIEATDAIPGAGGTAATAAIDADGGPGGRLSYVALSGGFGTITMGQIWSASAIHYGFKVDPSYVNGVFGGANYRNGNSVSYSSSAGDVSFQIDKVTGDAAKLEIGASANLGPVGIGFANWSNADDDAAFTGVAVSSEAAGLGLTVGLGSSTSAMGVKSKTNVLHVGGSVGDTGLSYAIQVANSDADGGAGDQNLLVVTNSLGSGASLIFEHVSPGVGDASSLLGLKVDF